MGYARYADLLFSTAKICMCIITAIAHATAVTHSITYGSYTFCAINKYTHAMQRDLLEPCAGQLARTVLRGGDRSDAVSLPDLAHKIREAMASEVKDLRLDGAGRDIEIDGCYVGGHVRPENRKEDRKDRRLAENQSDRRRVVVALRERRGRTLPFVCIREAEGVEIARTYVAQAAQMFADEAQHWDELHKHFPNTGRINHSMAYADGDDHTNWVESYFSRLRRMIQGQHHHVSARYLYQYANEAAWKEDHRRLANGAAFVQTLGLALASAVSRTWKGYWQRRKAT